jgi:hypothetical protein
MRSSLTVATLLATALALPLAACSKQPEVSATNATPSEVTQKVAATGGVTIEPGRWEGTTTIHDLEMPNVPNMPPQVKEQMKAQISGSHGFVSCVTADDVKKAFMTDRSSNKNCKFDHFTLSGGRIDAAMSCDQGREGKMNMTMTGAYSAQAYHMDMNSKAEGTREGGMTMKISIDAKRVGVCKGTPDEK